MPILCASCSAAPSAFGPAGTGRVKDVCTMPSPVVSPYGRMIVPSGTGHLLRLDAAFQELQSGVVGPGGQFDDAVQALAAVRWALGDAERAVGDRVHQSA